MQLARTRLMVFGLMVLAAGFASGCGETTVTEIVPATTDGSNGAPAAGTAGGNEPAERPVSLNVTADNAKIEWVGTKDDGRHDGGFKTVTGDVMFVASDMTSTRFTLSIDTTSLWSDTDKLTAHLKSPDFFEVNTYPTATFATTEVAADAGAATFTVTGDLTLHGVTKSITFPATIAWTDPTLTVSAEFKIKRQEFGISYGPDKVHDDVSLSAVFTGSR